MWRFLFIFLVIWGCIKKNESDENKKLYFIKAKFNGVPWEITKYGEAIFQGQLDVYRNRWKIAILADNNKKDTVCRYFSFTFDYVPKVGRHYFTNSPLTFLPDSGLICVYGYYHTIANTWFPKYSLNGYVDITEISRDEIKGIFDFDAIEGNADSSTMTSVTEGAFYLYNPGGGDNWPGPP